MVGKRTFNTPNKKDADNWRNADLESGQKPRRFGGFKDAVEYAMDRRTTAVLKEQLREGVDRNALEKYRMSDDEVLEPKPTNP